MKLSKKATAYLRLIGKTDDKSVMLTRGYAKQANELKNNGLAEYIPIARGGAHVALTEAGINAYEELSGGKET